MLTTTTASVLVVVVCVASRIDSYTTVGACEEMVESSSRVATARVATAHGHRRDGGCGEHIRRI